MNPIGPCPGSIPSRSVPPVVTIADVARHAGVASSTVSYVLTGRRSISPETTARVWDSIRTLGYRPRGAAAPPAARNSVGVVLPLRDGVNVAVAMRFVRAIVAAAREVGRDVLLSTGDDGLSDLARMTEAPVAGMIVMDVEIRDARLPALRASRIPSVLIGLPADTSALNCVDLDFAAAYALCVDHLADRGHRDIALLGAPKSVYERNTSYAHHGMAGFAGAALRRGVTSVVKPCEADGSAVLGVLSERPEITGFVVHNEAALQFVLAALESAGRNTDLVAICPDEVAERVRPRVCSVHLPAEDLGRRAVETLLNLMGGAVTASVQLTPPTLTLRDSH